VKAICKLNEPAALQAAITAITQMADESAKDNSVTREQQQAFKTLVNSSLVHNHLDILLDAGGTGNKSSAYWADAAVLDLASRNKVSPEVHERAKIAIDSMWSQADRRMKLVAIATALQNHYLDDRILRLASQSGADLPDTLTKAMKVLRLAGKMSQQLPLIATVGVETALQQVALTTGDVSRGQRLFREANCVACHTVSKDVKQQGPYLGNIAATYKRQQLAEAVLQPSKTIAQGFATTSILTVDGRVVVGFVTNELADRVTLRDAQANDHQIMKDDIEIRKTLKTSVMPEGLLDKYSVRDLAAIVDYLDSLVTP
jgi:putative heme-binding domain-containing protein